jgi:16S rRNA (guanine966-N2)-methyltransferase
MRVISGEWKGLTLVAPKGQVARPTTDRVKESMFNLLGWNWTGGVAVDLFAGSGALGIEALSRGAESAIFADVHPASLAALRENLTRCKAGHRAKVYRADWEAAWNKICAAGLDVGWVFVDPPYSKNLWVPVLTSISRCSVHPRFGVVCEHPKDVLLPSQVGDLEVAKSKVYGDIAVTMYRSYGGVDMGDDL